MISQHEYIDRRKKLARQLPAQSVAIISASSEKLRNGDAHYRFRQNSDFHYLTGFNEPNAVLLIFAGHEGTSILFNQIRNFAAEIWTGKRLGQEGACLELGMKEAFPYENLSSKLPELLADKSKIYYSMGRDPDVETLIMQTLVILKDQIRRGVHVPDTLCDLDPILSEMRLFKSESEIKLMRQAAEISVAAHQRAMKYCKQAQFEYQLEAELLHEFNRSGCRSVAYDPIVGAGANACILHYTTNDQRLNDGDLVLIDAGAEFHNYAADITRTFPINGQFSDEQRAIYELVLKAQREGIACIQPEVPWNRIQQIIIRVITTGLCELGILQGEVDHLIANEAYKPFYMHNSGHWLGLDVHDCGQYKINKEWRLLEQGMVLTVEPGIYIHANMNNVDKRWWNIGVRIEDDILVTQDGYENLTAALCKEIDDIEAFMRD